MKLEHFASKINAYVLLKEIIWLSITTLVSYAALYPVTQKIDFIYYNVCFAFVFVMLTYFRWTIMLSALPFFRPGWVRYLLFTINVALFFYLMSKEQHMLGFLDNFYTEDFGFPKIILYDPLKEELFRHLRLLITFCGTGSLIMIIALNLRLILSWWQFYKYRSEALFE